MFCCNGAQLIALICWCALSLLGQLCVTVTEDNEIILIRSVGARFGTSGLFNTEGLIVSSIYDWYRVDFGGTDAGVIRHLKKYASPALAERLASLTGATPEPGSGRVHIRSAKQALYLVGEQQLLGRQGPALSQVAANLALDCVDFPALTSLRSACKNIR